MTEIQPALCWIKPFAFRSPSSLDIHWREQPTVSASVWTESGTWIRTPPLFGSPQVSAISRKARISRFSVGTLLAKVVQVVERLLPLTAHRLQQAQRHGRMIQQKRDKGFALDLQHLAASKRARAGAVSVPAHDTGETKDRAGSGQLHHSPAVHRQMSDLQPSGTDNMGMRRRLPLLDDGEVPSVEATLGNLLQFRKPVKSACRLGIAGPATLNAESLFNRFFGDRHLSSRPKAGKWFSLPKDYTSSRLQY